jgi:hypothetical protein
MEVMQGNTKYHAITLGMFISTDITKAWKTIFRNSILRVFAIQIYVSKQHKYLPLIAAVKYLGKVNMH